MIPVLWLCIHCPKLALEALFPGLNTQAIAIAAQHRVDCCNQAASVAGISEGMSLATARALCPHLQVATRNPEQEHQILLNLIYSCYQFTPALNQYNETSLLLEIRGSLKLFQGLNKLIQNIKQEVEAQQISCTMGLANTAKSAYLLARHPGNKLSEAMTTTTVMAIRCFEDNNGKLSDQTHFRTLLHSIPVTKLDCSDLIIKKLTRSGFKTLGELLVLPMAELGKRYGKDFVRYLQQINGELPDPQSNIVFPETFDYYIECGDAISSVDHLLWVMQKVLHRLSNYLRARQMYCGGFIWSLYQQQHYSSINTTNNASQGKITIELYLTQARWDMAYFLNLTRIKLEALTLTAPTSAIRLKACDLRPAHYLSTDLLPPDIQYSPQRSNGIFTALIDTLSARLGENSLYQVTNHHRHIPEQASQLAGLLDIDAICVENNEIKTSTTGLRPTWLLRQPSPIQNRQKSLYYQGDLKLLQGPERIEGDWWSTAVSRDYYVARRKDDTLYWIYRDRHTQCWFVHGVFG